jgi:hypothetical protein
MDDNGLPTRNMVDQYGVELTIIQRLQKRFYVPDELTDVRPYLKQLGYCFPGEFRVLTRH